MFLTKEGTGLWIVDVQEKLFSLMDRSHEVLDKMCLMLEAAKILKLPIMVTEQYPQGLGHTIEPLRIRLPKGQKIFSKTTFSGYFDPNVRKAVDDINVSAWILIGIEAHICVLQTAKDLVMAQKLSAVANDAVTSRNIYDFSAAMGEMRDNKIRLTSVETLIYELVRDAKSFEFKEILSLVKENA